MVGALTLTGPPAWADDIRDKSWQLGYLNIDKVHAIAQGDGMTVAVIDTGVDPNHPDLVGNVLPGIDFSRETTNAWVDTTGHGTGTAALIAGHGHGPNNASGILGIAPKAKILPIRVYSSKPHAFRSVDMIGEAISAALERKVDVICIALSGGFSSVQRDAIQAAHARGVPVVAGSGNDTPEHGPVMGSPANITETIAVGTSNRDGKVDPISVGGPKLDLIAPGTDIPVPNPHGGYYTATGTSNSTAIVAGAAALIRQKYPKDDPNLLLQRLVWTTDHPGRTGRDWDYGWGVLNVLNALTKQPEDRSGKTPSPSSAPATGAHAAGGSRSGGASGVMLAAAGVAGVALLVGIGLTVVRRSRRTA